LLKSNSAIITLILTFNHSIIFFQKSDSGERTLLNMLNLEDDEDLKRQKLTNYGECAKHTDEVVDSNFRCFEKSRVVEMKAMLEEALRAEMLYHCRALEVLEPLCVSMRQLDPNRAMASMAQELDELNNDKADGQEKNGRGHGGRVRSGRRR